MQVKDKNGDVVELKNNIGGWCRYYLIKGELTNKEIVEKVRERFGGKTSINSVAWYKAELVEKGVIAGGKKAAAAMTLEQFEAADASAKEETAQE